MTYEKKDVGLFYHLSKSISNILKFNRYNKTLWNCYHLFYNGSDKLSIFFKGCEIMCPKKVDEYQYRNSERFLQAFNRITATLRKISGVKEHSAFFRLIDMSKKKSALVRKYEDDLRTYADLRNAIVHHRTSTEFVIAEPHIEVVRRIEKIDRALAKPKLVGQVFQKNVLTFQSEDSLAYALDVIRKRKFTQFPVYEGNEFKGLVTTVGITNWLATNLTDDYQIGEMPTLGDILRHEKNRINYKFVSRFITVYDAEEIFKQGVERGKRFEALLITEHGKQHQKLLGMITPIDIMDVN